MAKILIFAPQAIHSPHFETDLELAKKELDSGNEVLMVGCPGNLPLLCESRAKDPLACLECNSKRRSGIKMVPGLQYYSPELKAVSVKIPTFESSDHVKAFSYKGVDLGSAALSSYISWHREPSLPVSILQGELTRAIAAGASLIDTLEQILDSEDISRAYLFNGRILFYRPLLRLLQNRGIPFHVHERAGSMQRYSLTPNTFPHDLGVRKKMYVEMTSRMGAADAEQGARWFEARRAGAPQAWPSFIKGQMKGALPPECHGRRIISIFVSSQDEFESVPGWENVIYKNQNEGIQRILEDIPAYFLVVIRVHPNLKGLQNSQTIPLNRFGAHPKCLLVRAEEPIDSYALMEASEKVVTFGSTVGIEATFWGATSILAGGRSLYEDLNVTYNPQTHEELIQLLTAELKPKPRENTLAYGLMELNWGVPYKWFKADGFFSGFFMGARIKSLAGINTLRNFIAFLRSF